MLTLDLSDRPRRRADAEWKFIMDIWPGTRVRILYPDPTEASRKRNNILARGRKNGIRMQTESAGCALYLTITEE